VCFWELVGFLMMMMSSTRNANSMEEHFFS
jgi:hypothetical protein